MTGYLGWANRGVDEDKLGAMGQNERMDTATMLPAQAGKFDPETQTMSTKVMYKGLDSDGNEIAFPDLQSTPVVFPRGGGFTMTHPIKAGDGGTVHFASRDLDNYYTSGEAKAPNTSRLHDYSDGVFIPGFNPSGKAFANFDSANFFIGTDDHKNGFRVSPAGTSSIVGNGESLYQIIEDLMSILIASSDDEGPGFTGSVRTAMDACKTRLGKMKL